MRTPENLPAAMSAVGDEETRRRTVEDRFWDKVLKVAGRVPFVEDAVAAYYCAMDPATPARVRTILIGALAYFVVPADMIPDFITGFGFADDATVLTAAITAVGSHIRRRHRAAARTFLRKANRR